MKKFFRYELLEAVSGHACTLTLFFLCVYRVYFVPYWMDSIWSKICFGATIAFLLVGLAGVISTSVLGKKGNGAYRNNPRRKLDRLCLFLDIAGVVIVVFASFLDWSFRHVTYTDGYVASVPYPSMEQTIAISIAFACFVLGMTIDIASIIKRSESEEEK